VCASFDPVAMPSPVDYIALDCERESSLHVTNTTYSGLQEHRIIVYTATGQKAKLKVHLSTESTVTGNSSKTLEACRRETEEHKLKTAV
jgi:hypothetical protein